MKVCSQQDLQQALEESKEQNRTALVMTSLE
jgi:hypothetical protein